MNPRPDGDPPPLLAIEGLVVRVPTTGEPRTLVDGVDLRVEAGEIVGVAGESGSGKTLTASAALGLLPPHAQTEGRVLLDGEDVLTMPPARLRAVRGARVAMVFQDPMTSLHPMLDVQTQLTEQMRAHQTITRRDARARAVELLQRVRIPGAARALRSYPHHFSGGMRQRIAIASALACSPQLLVADEVTTALDVTVQAGILDLLSSLRDDTGMGIVFITHDLGVMNVIADRMSVMRSGQVVESGPCRTLLADPQHPYTRQLVDALPDLTAGPVGR